MITPLIRVLAFFTLCRVFVFELMKASLSVATAVFKDTSTLRPAIIAVPLDLKTDMGIATLANIVSLTPGTTSLHVSDDKSLLYIHVLDRDSDQEVIDEIKDRLERAVLPFEGSPKPQRDVTSQGARA
ncbi:MAG: Na+/H+ antiporter subunit E [Pseudomonadota bacterium]